MVAVHREKRGGLSDKCKCLINNEFKSIVVIHFSGVVVVVCGVVVVVCVMCVTVNSTNGYAFYTHKNVKR